MTRSTFALFILFLLKFSALNGQGKVDSLQSKLAETTTDSTRIKILLSLSAEYQFLDISESEKLIEEAIKIAEQKSLLNAKAEAYKEKASLESIKGNYASAIKFNDIALNLFFQSKDSIGVAKCYNNLGRNYYGLGKFDEAYFYHTQSYQVANAIHNHFLRAISLHNVGTVFKELSQYETAIDHLKLSLTISKSVNDPEALPYYYSEVGDIFMRKKQYDSALYSLKLSLKFLRKIKLMINELEPTVLINIAKTYLYQNDKDKALHYYDSAAFLFNKTDSEFGLAEVELGRGMVFMSNKKFDEAQQVIEKSAEVAHRLNAWTLEGECYENLSKLHEEKGDLKKSLYYFKRHQAIDDSLFSQAMQAKLFQDQIRFEINSKEEQILALTKKEQSRKDEVRKQELVRNMLVVAVAVSIFLLFSVYRSGQRKIKINKLLMERQVEVKKRSEELEQLNKVKDKFFSIISHDLRSPMNALSAILDLMDKNQLSPAEFSNLNKELRIQFNHTKTLINNLLDWALLQMDKLKIQQEKVDLHSLAEANANLVSSLQVKEVKIINKIKPSTFALCDSNMINLVMRNLMMNAIKFSEAGDLVEISSNDDGGNYIISVKDNGVGIKPEVQSLLFEKTSGYSTRGTANEKGTGLGLILCKEFVERNGGKIWLESEMGVGSTFYFTIKKAS